jgi:Family of unknown function (DUF6524)
MGRLTLGGFAARFAAAFLLVILTYNPTGLSFGNWLGGNFPHIQPLQAIIGLVLLCLWVFFLHATWRSLGALGVILGLAFFACIGWLFYSWGWLHSPSHSVIVWLVLVFIACMLTVGLCWGLVRARVSGQAVMEEVDR